jgi:heat shock protein HslJ
MKLIPTFILCLLMLSCEPEEASQLPGKWKLVGIASAEGGVFFKKPSDEKREVILNLPNPFPTEFTGKAACNEFWGQLNSLGGRNIKVERYGATQIYCPSWGPAFEDRVHKVTRYEVKSGILYLYLEDERMIFLKVD